MIGVQTKPEEREIAVEFFELFKTQWEFAKPGRRYDVLLNAGDDDNGPEANLVVRYQTEVCLCDATNNLRPKPRQPGTKLRFAGRSIPLYGTACAFPRGAFNLSVEGDEQLSIVNVTRDGERTIVRVGYNLFGEICHLLTVGQPVANAAIPTLDLHITLLREIITRAGLPLIEIPAVPDGHRFIVCLTHDLDNPIFRNHRFDATMIGFLGRATLGGVRDVCAGKKSFGKLCRNWLAAGSAPFVHLGLVKDPWRGFHGYLQMESGLGATYFVIPRKDYAGRQTDELAAARRPVRYEPGEIHAELQEVQSSGCEVGLHGLDAWIDSGSAVEERSILERAKIDVGDGVRMHWLMFDRNSPLALEAAGFAYDSSVGYNETVGYKAGTSQAYKPFGTTRLLELPLHVMDTALFFPGFMNLTDADAERVVWRMIDDVEQFGGAMTINWHDRSIAPERLWGDFYQKLIDELKKRGAWFPTASTAVAWFRKRRTTCFKSVNWSKGVVELASAPDSGDCPLPGLKVRVQKPSVHNLFEEPSFTFSANHVDAAVGVSSFSTARATIPVFQHGN